ncbi:WD repeat-containing protein 44 isoform X2 [Toxorhynchites rutilus septentrionalis]|uniref:WD repeat-containing protein 44 isoform X2 n=1 Tax=Toxorhynchites rutilus septentrionalis TaxID=329112 RepID=UPI00247AF6B2|nr:WD repeat-containing protein 44 isoform X2 [Toxorhynchites rutilus septentrionalis]
MASASESSDEFFDAEDDNATNHPRDSSSSSGKKRSPKIKTEKEFLYPEQTEEKRCEQHSDRNSQSSQQMEQHQQNHQQVVPQQKDGTKFIEPKTNSSVEGVYSSSTRTSHPFRVIEGDALSIQSMTSLGRVGRILAGSASVDASGLSIGKDSTYLAASTSSAPHSLIALPSSSSRETQLSGSSSIQSSSGGGVVGNVSTENIGTCKYDSYEEIRHRQENTASSDNDKEHRVNMNVPLQEPDVIASTKLAHSKTTDSLTCSGPVAPPRRKKKTRKLSSSSSEQFNMNEGLKLPPPDSCSTELTVKLPIAQTSIGCNNEPPVIETTGEGQILPSPATLASITRQIENSFQEATIGASNGSPAIGAAGESSGEPRKLLTGSMGRIPNSLGNSSSSVHSKPSPSNSVKSNSAPARVSSIDPSQGLNIYKAIKGQYVVKPTDGAFNKAQGPSREEIERVEKIRLEIMGNTALTRASLSGTGTNSLGSGTRYGSSLAKHMYLKERRKSAGDEDMFKQLNIYVKTRTDSGKQLTDMEILEQIPVKNLDTGENFPLSAVEEKLPQCINPLSLHIMRLTSHIPESDEESIGPPPGSEAPAGFEEDLEIEEEAGRLKKKTAKIKRFFRSTARKTVDKAKSIASEVSHARHKEDVADIEDVVNPEQNIKIKASSTNKGPYEFAKLQHVQDLSGEHTGAVWCMKFSSCGRLLATAGQDRVLRIWVLKDAYHFFQDMRTKYNAADQKSSPTPSQESLVSHHSAEEAIALAIAAEKSPGPFMPKSFCTYSGHTSDLLDVSWSKNYFILSSSMDKTVRLWHISRKECLCCFQHIDFVTAIAFHPRDDRYFLSGSLDGKLRLWNIPDKKVALWNEVDGQTKLITAANFCQNGKFAVVGSYDGRCLFYNTDQLKYHTQIHVRSTRGKNAIGRKISGIEPMPGEDKILVTSNDSRIRLYDLRDLNLSCKYKGYLNVSSQIKASFSHDGKYIISGSENQMIYIWKTHHDYAKLSSVRRDRSDFWEGIKAHNATVTCAIFAPHPEAIIKPEPDDEINADNISITHPADPLVEQRKKGCGGYVLVSADFNGCIKVFINKTKPKHSSLPYTAILD